MNNVTMFSKFRLSSVDVLDIYWKTGLENNQEVLYCLVCMCKATGGNGILQTCMADINRILSIITKLQPTNACGLECHDDCINHAT